MYAREPSGTITMPAAPPPRLSCLTSLRVAASITTRLLPAVPPPPPPAIKTRLPSGVNFSRLAPLNEIGRVCVTRLAAVSMMVTVASCAFAAQISLPSGDTSKPSAPRPAATLVTRHVFRGPPGGGLIPGGGPPAGGVEPGGPLLPGGGPKPPLGGETCSMMLIVPELPFDVTIQSRLSETPTMSGL